MKILFTGGGTAGSVIPLLAIYEEIKKRRQKSQFFWIGTYNGVEQSIVQPFDIEYNAILSGKLRRYFSWRNFFDIFLFIIGFIQAFFLLLSIRPQRVISAGGFVGVPVIYASWILRIPIFIHQLDIRLTLSNKITAFCATKITVSYKKSLNDYSASKVEYTGVPIREQILKTDGHQVYSQLNLNKNKPIILIVGGGTGALAINKLVKESIDKLLILAQVVHVYGKERDVGCSNIDKEGYHGFEILHDEYPAILAVCHIVIARSGIGTLSELSAIGKPAIIIPIPNSHQEDNALYFEQEKAIIYLRQNELDANMFVKQIKSLLQNKEIQHKLSKNIKNLYKANAESKIVDLILNS